MNKKGFTLVEILCVIVILSIMAVMISSGVVKMSLNSKNKLLCTKIKLIEAAAVNYGANYEKELNESLELYQDNKSITITIDDLVKNNFLQADKENMIINPVDDKSMNQMQVIIYLENNRIKAHVDNNVC